MRAVAELIGRRRARAQKRLLVNDTIRAAGMEIGEIDNAAVDDGDADACAGLAVAVGPVGVYCAVGDLVECRADRTIGRDVSDVGIVRERLQGRFGNGVVRALMKSILAWSLPPSAATRAWCASVGVTLYWTITSMLPATLSARSSVASLSVPAHATVSA
jgi:hypothetical protein